MATIAITGGRGFIGGRLAIRHLESGDSVRILTRSSGGGLPVKYWLADLTDPNADFSGFVDSVDVLYHCAGELADESLMPELHVEGIKRLLDFAIGNVGRWVQLSSVGVYGLRRSGRIDESTVHSPVGVYEQTKWEADTLLKKIASPNNLDYSVIQPSIVFGHDMPNQSLRQLANMLKRGLFLYMGNRQAIVNYVPVESVVDCMMLCGQHENSRQQSYIVSQSTTVQSMVEALCDGMTISYPRASVPESLLRSVARLFQWTKRMPLTSSRIDALTGSALYDSNKIKNELGFSPRQSLEDALSCFSKELVRGVE